MNFKKEIQKQCFFANILEFSVPQIGENAVCLLVRRGFEQIDLVVDVRIGGEEVLEAVVVEIE